MTLFPFNISIQQHHYRRHPWCIWRYNANNKKNRYKKKEYRITTKVIISSHRKMTYSLNNFVFKIAERQIHKLHTIQKTFRMEGHFDKFFFHLLLLYSVLFYLFFCFFFQNQIFYLFTYASLLWWSSLLTDYTTCACTKRIPSFTLIICSNSYKDCIYSSGITSQILPLAKKKKKNGWWVWFFFQAEFWRHCHNERTVLLIS